MLPYESEYFFSLASVELSNSKLLEFHMFVWYAPAEDEKEWDFAFVDLSSWICSFWAERSLTLTRAPCVCVLAALSPTCSAQSIRTHTPVDFHSVQSGWMRYIPSDRIAPISQLHFINSTLVLSSRLSLITSTYTKDGARNYFCIRPHSCVLGEVKQNKKRAFGKHGKINENSLIRPRFSQRWVGRL